MLLPLTPLSDLVFKLTRFFCSFEVIFEVLFLCFVTLRSLHAFQCYSLLLIAVLTVKPTSG